MDSTLTLCDRLTNVREMYVANALGVRSTDPRLQAKTVGRDLARLGLGEGDRLAVVLPNGPDFVATFIACLQHGMTFVPLHPGISDDDLVDRCRAANVTGLLSARGGLLRVVSADPFPSQSTDVPAAIFFTSGSSGTARPVALSEQALLHVADTHHTALGYSPGEAITGYLSWSHTFGFTLELLMGLLYQGLLCSISATDFPKVFDASPGECLFTVPRMIERLSDRCLGNVRAGIVGGAPVHGRVRRRLQATQLRVGYGQTECAPGVSLGDSGEWEFDDFLGRRLGCALALRTDADERLGELFVQGPNLAMGYVQGDQLMPVASPDGWRATGDLATPCGDGFVFQGRRDELFKLDNGRMVNPVPLERPYDGSVLLVGEGREAVQPLMRGAAPQGFTLPVPYLQPRAMPEDFWSACTTPTGKVSRRRAQQLFYQA